MKTSILNIIALLILWANLPASATTQADSTVPWSFSPQQRQFIAVAALTAQGSLETLKPRLNSALDSGVTVNQLKEAIVHVYAYCGFPRSIRGLQTLMAVLEERKAKGIKDERGPDASSIMDTRSKYDRGKDILAKLTGVLQDGPKTGYAAFSPEIETFLKEHLFADLFERDVLSYAERELVTISVLSSIGGVEPMLASHLNICLNVGITPAQLREFTSVIHSTIGANEATAAQTVVNTVLNNKAR